MDWKDISSYSYPNSLFLHIQALILQHHLFLKFDQLVSPFLLGVIYLHSQHQHYSGLQRLLAHFFPIFSKWPNHLWVPFLTNSTALQCSPSFIIGAKSFINPSLFSLSISVTPQAPLSSLKGKVCSPYANLLSAAPPGTQHVRVTCIWSALSWSLQNSTSFGQQNAGVL